MNYYDKDQNGDIRWDDWIAVLWLTITTWVFGQLAFTAPFMSMLAELDPDASARLDEVMGDLATTTDLATVGFGVLLIVVGWVGAAIGYGIHYLGNRGRPSRIIGLIGALTTLVGAILYFMGMGAIGEANTIILSVIGLSPIAYMLMLLTFPAALVGLYIGWTLVHKLPLTNLHTALMRFRWGRVGQSFLIMWGVLAVYGLVLGLFTDHTPRFVFDASRFLPYAIISLLLLPVQSATEEIVVRGYMNKGLTHWFSNKWVAFIITSGLFTALHLSNPEATAGADAGNLPVVMSGYFFFGFAACLMVLIDNGLESAIGVHAANNTFAAIFINYENSALPTPSIWIVPNDPAGSALSTIFILIIVLGLLYVTRRKTAE